MKSWTALLPEWSEVMSTPFSWMGQSLPTETGPSVHTPAAVTARCVVQLLTAAVCESPVNGGRTAKTRLCVTVLAHTERAPTRKIAAIRNRIIIDAERDTVRVERNVNVK